MSVIAQASYFGIKFAAWGVSHALEVAVGSTDRKNLDLDAKKADHVFLPLANCSKIRLACVAFPPTFGNNREHYDVDTIVNYWKNNPDLLKTTRGIMTVGENICLRLLNDEEPLPLTQSEILAKLKEINEVQPGLPYKPKHSELKIKWKQVLSCIHKLNFIIEDNQVAKIQQYNSLIKMLAKLPGETRYFMTYICELVYNGPLEHLASSADVANIRYVLNKFKPLNASQQLHKLFCSPTWQGKVSALISLIELFEIDLMEATTNSISYLAHAVVKIVAFLMEKTDAGIKYLQKTFNWMSAEEPEEIEMQAIGEKCRESGCENKVTKGCSICISHFCNEHKICKCPDDYEHSIDECHCSNDQDCWYRAVAAQVNMTNSQVKMKILEYLETPECETDIQLYVEATKTGEFMSAEQILNDVRSELAVDIQCSHATHLVTGLALKKNIALSSVIVNEMRSFKNIKKAQWIKVKHYFMTEEAIPHFEMDKSLPATGFTHNIFGGLVNEWFNGTASASNTPPISLLAAKDATVQNINLAADLVNTKKKNTDDVAASTFSVDLSTLSNCSDVNKTYIDKHIGFMDPQSVDHEMQMNANQASVKMEKKSGKRKVSWGFSNWFRSMNLGSSFEVVKDWLDRSARDVITWFDDNPMIAGVIAIISGIASFFGLYVSMPTRTSGMAGIIKKFSDASRVMHYTKSGFGGMLGMCSDVLSEMRGYLGISKDKEVNEFKQEVADMLCTCKEMYLNAQTNPADFINNGQNFLDFRDNMKRVMETYRNIVRVKKSDCRDLVVLNPIWFNLTRTYESLSKMYTKFVNGMSTRRVPVCTYIYGDTGIGKSALLTQLINDLNKVSKRQMKVFTVSKGVEFWNNYSQQQVIRFDDMNAIVGNDGDLDSILLFNLVTDAPYNPNQASLEDKFTMATPAHVICASNFSTVPSNTMVSDITAWESRRHICVYASFPEHAGCKIRDPKCEHFKNLRIDNFDHLTLTLVDPCMSEMETNQNKQGRIYKKVSTKSDAEIIRDGERITYQDLVNQMLELERIHAERYELALKTAIECGTALKLQATSYAKNPTFALVGPPGTGKSHIFQIISEKLGESCLRVVTDEDLKAFLDGHHNKSLTQTTVIIDDVSSFLHDTKLLNNLLALIQRRYNVPANEHSYALYVGVNRECLIETVGYERYEQIFRRCEQAHTEFNFMSQSDKKKIGISLINRLKKINYCAKDIAREPERIDEMVGYIYNGKRLTQQNMAEDIMSFKPVVKEIKILKEIPDIKEANATCLAEINLTERELLAAINSGSLTSIFRVFDKCEMKKSESCKFTTKQLFQHISDIVRKCRLHDARTIQSLDELFIQSWNSKFLEVIRGECCVLKLRDYCLVVDGMEEEIKLGKLTVPEKELSVLMQDLEKINEFNLSGALDGLTTAILPPWLLFSSEIIMSIVAYLGTGVGMAVGMMDQIKMFNAYRESLSIDKVFGLARESQADVTKKSVARKFNLSPGAVSPHAPQYGVASDLTSYFEVDDGDVRPRRETSPSESDFKQTKSGQNLRQETDPKDEDPDKLAQRLRDEEEDRTYSKNMGRRSRSRKKKVNNGKTNANHQCAPVDYEYLDRQFVNCAKTAPVMETEEIFEVQANTEGVPTDGFNKEDVEMQIATDPGLYNIVTLVFKNTCEIITVTGKRLCSGLFTGGNIVRTVAHVLTDDIKKLRVRTLDSKVWNVEISFIDEMIDRLDLKITDTNFQKKPDISHHFPTMSRVVGEGQVAVLVTPKIDMLADSVAYSIRSYIVKNACFKEFVNMGKNYYCIDYRGHRMGFITNGVVQTEGGDCGSVLILADPSVRGGKVIGIHMAGTTSVAYASPLYVEQYKEPVMQCCEVDVKIPESHFTPLVDKYPLVAECKEKNHISGKTRLFRNWFPIGKQEFEPAILTSADPRCKVDSMLFKESAKWLAKPNEISDEHKNVLWESVTEVAHYFVDVMHSHGKSLRVLTKTEAINRIPESSHSEAVNVHTSPGYPWSKGTKKAGKMDYISVLEDGSRRFNKDNPDKIGKLHNAIDLLLKEKPDGIGNLAAFQVFLKDEPVKLSRIYCEADQQKTRTIAAAPLHFQVAYRMYFHTAHAAMMDLHEELPIKVGINPLSMDWHSLFHKLAGKSQYIIASDFKGWDFSHNPFLVELLRHFYDILYSALDKDYAKEDAEVRFILYSKIKNFYLLIGNTLAQTQKGIPSGYPGTTPDNSILNVVLSNAAWKIIMRKSGYPSLANYLAYREDVEAAVYADDKVEAVSAWAIKHYNGLTVPSIVAEFGFEMQPASKDSEFVAYEHVKDAVFLSRTFKFMRGFWVGALQMNRLCKTSWFIHDDRTHYFWESPEEKCKNIDSVVSAHESMLYEASLHGEGVFNQFRKIALEVYSITQHRIPPRYHECLARLFGNKREDEVSKIEHRDCSHLLDLVKKAWIRPPNYVHHHNRECWSFGPNYEYTGSGKINNKHNAHTVALLEAINTEFGTNHNSVLFNDYPVGGEIPWHKDNEKGLNIDAGIIGLTARGNGRLEIKGLGTNLGFFQSAGMAYILTPVLLKEYYHRRVYHSERTITVTFRTLEVPEH